MFPLLFALVLASATSTFGGRVSNVPPYVHYKLSYDRAVKELNTHLVIDPDRDITDPNRHYVAIVNAILLVVENIAVNGSNFDDIYLPTVDIALPRAFRDPLTVVDEVQELLAKVEDNSKLLTTLMATTCSFDKDPDACSQVIDDEVKGDPERYQHAADTLVAAGLLADNYLDKASDLAIVASLYREVIYLIQSRDDVKQLVDLAVTAYNLIN